MPADLPTDVQTREAAAWRDFVQRLGRLLAAQWPAMQERLGERHDAFVDAALAQAEKRGFTHAASVARYVNLWFVWGPAFHDKPGFEWALGLLAAPREHEWLTVHQLVQRSLAELQRRPEPRIQPAALIAADERLHDQFGRLGRQGSLLLPPDAPLPRKACDIEAAELRLTGEPWLQEYRLVGDDWQRVSVPLPAALRVDAVRPLPKLIGVLTSQRGLGPQAQLQVRIKPHAGCNGDVHPGIDFSGTHGRWRWVGHETRSTSWPVATLEQPGSPAGPGTVVAEESSPDIFPLELLACGLRDEGEPIGSLKTRVWAWPAAQWWVEVQRAVPTAQTLQPGGRAWARGVTRCRVERDGSAQDSTPLRLQFEEGLDGAVAAGLQALAAAWLPLPGLAAPSVDVTLGLLTGKAACTWGWRAAPAGLDGRALMRLVARLEMSACQADIQLGGELELAGTRSRLRLHVAGQAALRERLAREATEPPLADAILRAAASFSFPFQIDVEPLASEQGSLLQLAGPLTGALVGEAGLRPNTAGGTGWEWFAGLRIESVLLPLCVTDPLLGSHTLVLPLLPAMTLLDWSLA